MDNDTSQAFAMAASTVNNLAATADSWRAREFAKEQNEIAWHRTVDAWNSANTYNAPSAQIQRLRDAGLNPMYYGLDGSSADAFEAPAQAQYQQAQWGAMKNPISVGLDAQLQQKQADLLDAQKLNIQSKTDSQTLENEFNRQTFQARVRGEELKNEISEEEKKSIMQKRNLVAEEIRKTANEADNEFEKKFLIQAETRLRKASADEIITLLPYKQLNLEADTMAKKAAAAAASMSALKDKKFIELGGVEAQIEETKARITKLAQDKKTSEAQEQAAKAKAALDAWKNSVQNGTAFNYIIEDPNANEFERELAGFFNGMFNVASMVTTTVGNILPKF